jgi:hypothetical protein
MITTTPTRLACWWVLGTLAAIALAAGLGQLSLSTPSTDDPMTTRPRPTEDRALNLLWHYERDLRALVRGTHLCPTRLSRDVGCQRLQDAQRRILIDHDYAAGVDLLTADLRLNLQERQAWITMLPILHADEERPSWQKAGVQR